MLRPYKEMAEIRGHDISCPYGGNAEHVLVGETHEPGDCAEGAED
jgi:hypothetical protein